MNGEWDAHRGSSFLHIFHPVALLVFAYFSPISTIILLSLGIM